MENAQIRALLGGHLTDLLTNLDELPVELRPYQVETLESATRWLLDSEGSRRAYVNYATGLGKTVVFASMIRAAAGLRVLVIVPTKVLLVQTARVIAQFTNGMLGHLSSLANIKDASGETVAVRGLDHSAVVVTTDASFNRHAAQIMSGFDPHLILRDECHWGYDDAAIAAMNQFDEAVIIGFSATPDYLTNQVKDGYVPVELENGLKLYGPLDRFADTHFQTCLDRRTLGWGIGNAWLCPLAWGRIEFDVDLKKIPVVDGSDGPDFDEGTLQKVMRKHWSVMCETIRRLYENGEYDLANRQVYAICSSVKDAEELAQTISSLGISTGFITGATSEAEREILLQAFRDNEIRFLSSVMVLREGWDSPNAEVCMMLRPTKSRVLYEQAIGRGLRQLENGGFKVALVLDAHFQGPKFSPLSAPILFGKPGDEIRMGDILVGPGGGVRGGEGVESPFLPKDAQPRLVVIDTYGGDDETEIRADNNGILFADGEQWITVRMMARRLQIAPSTITSRLLKQPCRHREGLSRKGQPYRFYSLKDLTRVCADVLHSISHLPEANSEGVYDGDGEHWVTKSRAQKDLGIGEPAIVARLASVPCRSMQIRLRGQVVTVYPLGDLIRVCQDLLDDNLVPLKGNGTARVNGADWYILKALAKRFGTTNNPVKERLDAGACAMKKGRTRSGHIVDCYLLSEAERLCQDLDRSGMPRADKDGIILADGEDWANIEALARMFSMTPFTVKQRLIAGSCRTKQGIGLKNREYKYFSVVDAEQLCVDPQIKDLPRAGSQGTFALEGLEYAPLSLLVRRWSIAFTALQRRIRPDNCRMHKGVERRGRVITFHAVEDVRRAAKDLLDNSHKRKRFSRSKKTES